MWKRRALSSGIEVKHGFAFPGSGFSDDPTLPTVLTPANFAIGGGFQQAKTKTFDDEFSPDYELASGDLVVSMTDLSKEGATLGSPAMVPAGDRYLHNQRIGLVILKQGSGWDLRFLNYYLRTAEYRAHILGTATGSTVRHTSPSRITAFAGEVPHVSEQVAIAEVLGAVDDKIDANERVIERADELARAEWTSALRASRTLPLSTLARFVNGRAFTRGASGTGRVVIRIAELNSGLGGSTVYNDIEVADDNLARPGDLLFAWSGSLTAARWFREEAIVNQHIFKCIPVESLSVAVVNQALHSALGTFKGIAADKATTMGHIQRKHLDIEVAVPADDDLAEVTPRLDALWDAALAVERESETLTRTRDALLPLLMSGKLRVRDAEREIEEVL